MQLIFIMYWKYTCLCTLLSTHTRQQLASRNQKLHLSLLCVTECTFNLVSLTGHFVLFRTVSMYNWLRLIIIFMVKCLQSRSESGRAVGNIYSICYIFAVMYAQMNIFEIMWKKVLEIFKDGLKFLKRALCS